MSYMDERRGQKINGKKEPEKKVYRLKRTPLKKSKTYRIKKPKNYRMPKVAEKRKIQNKEYSEKRIPFLAEGGGLCELQVPGVCTRVATDVHHPAGRTGNKLLDFKGCMRSCNPCNIWVEANDAEAWKMGLKKTRLGPSEKRPAKPK